jgi:hypothetical protein
MESRRFSIPIYLNQRIVFDLLAIVEEGFTQLQTVRSLETDTKSSQKEAIADVGSKNVFAFLNLGIKGSLAKKGEQKAEKEVQEEKVFTPASLFSKLRDSLLERKLLVNLDESFDHDKIQPEKFVEFSGLIRKSPMVGYMEGVIKVMEVGLLFNDTGSKHKLKEQKEILNQMKKFLEMLMQDGSLDLIANLTFKPEVMSVIPVQLEYFSKSPADIIDGQFVVLGKIVRYIPENSESSINLLRKTPLALLPEEYMSQVIGAFDEFSTIIDDPEKFTTHIKGPALLVVPIAIYA